MSTSTLDPENSFELDQELKSGCDIATLGPSDTSDSGSDVANGDRLEEELGILPSRNPLTGIDQGAPDLDGDQSFANDTDSTGTGERGSAGSTEVRLGQDIGVDRIDRIDRLNLEE